jgi:hypothetical protein
MEDSLEKGVVPLVGLSLKVLAGASDQRKSVFPIKTE